HVPAPVELPSAAEAGAVVDDLLVGAELDLGRDPEPGTHRVDPVGFVHVLLDRLRTGGKRQGWGRQAGKDGEAVGNLAVHRVAAPLLLLVCTSLADTPSPYSGAGGTASSGCTLLAPAACTVAAGPASIDELSGCLGDAVE